MNQDLLTAIISLLTLLGSGLIGILIAWLRKKLGVEKMRKIAAELDSKQAIVEAVVLCVQQVYKAAKGTEKYEKAVVMAVEWLSEFGFTVSAVELETLIESAVKTLKLKFADAWAEVVDGDFKIGGTDE